MALPTKTLYQLLAAGQSVSLHGARFRSLVSVDETARPPGGGVTPAVLGPVPAQGYALDAPNGQISRAPGLDPLWVRIVYQWEDAPTQEQLDAAQAAADLSAETPLLQAQLSAALAALVADETERAADALALASAGTLAAVKPIVSRMLTRDALRIKVETRMLRALAAKLGIPVTQPQGLKGLAAPAGVVSASVAALPTVAPTPTPAKKDKKP